MLKVKLSSDGLLELNNLKRKYQGDAKVFRRLRCIELRNEGMKPRQVFEKLDVSADSVTDRVKLFLSGGFKALCNMNYEGRHKSEYEQYKQEIEMAVKEKCFNSYKELWAYMVEKHNVETKESACYKFCKKKGIQYGKNAT